jgi:2-phosphosulfolactate phosphatase
MNVDIYFSPAEVPENSVEGRTAVVIDVIRATSCIVEAMANGARAIFPTPLAENAIKLASDLGREDTFLCGERKGIKIEGFDLGNSPAEFTVDVVEGKQLVMSTTNGTRALLSVEDADRVLVASFLNLSAVAGVLKDVSELLILCAGREDRFALDDALCAGYLARKVLGGVGREGALLNDGARVALDLAEKYEVTEAFLRSTMSGGALEAAGAGGDLALCACIDQHTVVPEMRERRIELGKVR